MSESSQKEPAPEDRYLKKMLGIIKTGTHKEQMDALLLRIKARLPELEELARALDEAEEDGLYRFYHGSYKVFTFRTRSKEHSLLLKRSAGNPIHRTTNIHE
jgi:hypothetical protein